ncbi:MAG: hypothetical protein AAF721_23385 [Myxococcota bacterium]
MPLTQYATDFLATLRRDTAVPTALVEKRIRDAGHDPHPVWLEFHDEYAGYIEELTPGDNAFWGLCHAADREPPPVWVDADQVHITPPSGQLPQGIVCADAHPVHDYELLANGHFLGVGGPAESFDRKLERHGLMMAFYKRGKVVQTRFERDLAKAENVELIDEMRGSFLPEPSDKHAQYYLEPKRLLRVGPLIKQLVLYEVDPPAPAT